VYLRNTRANVSRTLMSRANCIINTTRHRFLCPILNRKVEKLLILIWAFGKHKKRPCVNFTNIFPEAFMCANPKRSRKNTDGLTIICAFGIWAAGHVIAARKMLVKSTPCRVFCFLEREREGRFKPHQLPLISFVTFLSVIRCRFHQHFTRSFYSSSSQKHIKHWKL